MSWVDAPGVKIFSTPSASSVTMSLGGDDAPAEHQDVARPALAEQPHDLREQRHVGARMQRQPDRVGVLLDRRLDDLLGCLVQARVDDLETRVAQGSGDDLRAPVVPVEARLRHDHPEGLAHRARV